MPYGQLLLGLFLFELDQSVEVLILLHFHRLRLTSCDWSKACLLLGLTLSYEIEVIKSALMHHAYVASNRSTLKVAWIQLVVLHDTDWVEYVPHLDLVVTHKGDKVRLSKEHSLDLERPLNDPEVSVQVSLNVYVEALLIPGHYECLDELIIDWNWAVLLEPLPQALSYGLGSSGKDITLRTAGSTLRS